MEKNKIETYLGFCIRSRKIVFGAESIEKLRKGVYLLVIDGGVGKNSLKSVLLAQERLRCPIVASKDAGGLGETLHRPAVKAAAVTDKNLAAAILAACEGDSQFKLYSGGTN